MAERRGLRAPAYRAASVRSMPCGPGLQSVRRFLFRSAKRANWTKRTVARGGEASPCAIHRDDGAAAAPGLLRTENGQAPTCEGVGVMVG